jgi:hypothetical protein
MGACLGRGPQPGDGSGGATSLQGSNRHRAARRTSTFSDSTSTGGGNGSHSLHTKNRPLRHEKIRWKSDVPLTPGQLKSKRDEFWDTAPAFDGKQEIWAALKAATEATETTTEQGDDFQLAQAILDGAGISLPHGSLIECYDELGTRYTIPVYCLSNPVNLVVESGRDSPAEFSEPVPGKGKTPEEENRGREVKLRIRVSLTSATDVRLIVNTADSIRMAKVKLFNQEKKTEGLAEPCRQRWYFGGKLLGDKLKVGELSIPQGYVIQCIINPMEFNVVRPSNKD